MIRSIVRLVLLLVVLGLGYLLIAKPLLKSDVVDPHRLIHCVQKAKQDTKKLERCTRHF